MTSGICKKLNDMLHLTSLSNKAQSFHECINSNVSEIDTKPVYYSVYTLKANKADISKNIYLGLIINSMCHKQASVQDSLNK